MGEQGNGAANVAIRLPPRRRAGAEPDVRRVYEGPKSRPGAPFLPLPAVSTTMHVYLRDEPVRLRMLQVDADGLHTGDADLVPIAFYAEANERPSFRAMLPPQTVALLGEALRGPVQLGLLAEEPEDPAAEVQAMVGVSIPADELPEAMRPEDEEAGSGEELEPWQSAPSSEAWRGDDAAEAGDGEEGRTVMLAFAPLVRLARRHPEDFGEELADLLESALSGATKPALEARVDRMLGM